MKLILTVYEESAAAAMAAIGSATEAADAIELRADAVRSGERLDFRAVRAATDVPLIFTRRSRSGHSGRVDEAELSSALEAGFEFVDVEMGEHSTGSAFERFRDRAILSFHDFEGMPADLPSLLARMVSFRCAATKIAVMPRSLEENVLLLNLLEKAKVNNLTILGMGPEGLYSRILAPFFGSELVFVASSEEHLAAPGQLTLRRALEIYGDQPPARPRSIFAVVGKPAAHSLSPSIHNSRFREAGVSAAYSVLDTPDFGRVTGAMKTRSPFAPVGISITAPYKEEAFEFAREAGAEIAPNAEAAGSANTLIRSGDSFLADNTDVDAFEAILGRLRPAHAAVIGAGGSARAALVATQRLGIDAVIFNRTADRAERVAALFGVRARPLGELREFRGGAIVNTTGTEIYEEELEFAPVQAWIELSYSGPMRAAADAARTGAAVVGGLEFLSAQAERQSALFIEAAKAEERSGNQNEARGERR